MISLYRKILRWVDHWQGPRTEFHPGTRLFHIVSMATCILLLLMIPFNMMLDQYKVVWLLVGLLLAHGSCYFISRVKRKYKTAVAGVAFLAYAGASVNYFVNSGIDGPTLFIFFFTFQLLVAVTGLKYNRVHFILTGLVVGSLLYAQFRHPEWIKYSFESRSARYINSYVVFLFILLFIYLITRSLISSYYIEKKKADERALELERQHEKLEKTAAEKEKLFSIIFHDLKSPLASIQMYLETIRESPADADKEWEDGIKEELLRQTKETRAVLDSMLFWARSQAENARADRKPVDVCALVNSCLLIEKPFAAGKRIQFSLVTPEKLILSADPNMLQILLRILINNAIKFTPVSSTVYIDIKEDGDRCLIRVKDSGKGISPENRDKIFTLNIRGTKGTNDEKGAGLGLALARQFAARQQIDLWFDSKPGEGAAFFLALPIRPKVS